MCDSLDLFGLHLDLKIFNVRTNSYLSIIFCKVTLPLLRSNYSDLHKLTVWISKIEIKASHTN